MVAIIHTRAVPGMQKFLINGYYLTIILCTERTRPATLVPHVPRVGPPLTSFQSPCVSAPADSLLVGSGVSARTTRLLDPFTNASAASRPLSSCPNPSPLPTQGAFLLPSPSLPAEGHQAARSKSRGAGSTLLSCPYEDSSLVFPARTCHVCLSNIRFPVFW